MNEEQPISVCVMPMSMSPWVIESVIKLINSPSEETPPEARNSSK